jgi:hypothetical protein
LVTNIPSVDAIKRKSLSYTHLLIDCFSEECVDGKNEMSLFLESRVCDVD